MVLFYMILLLIYLKNFIMDMNLLKPVILLFWIVH